VEKLSLTLEEIAPLFGEAVPPTTPTMERRSPQDTAVSQLVSQPKKEGIGRRRFLKQSATVLALIGVKSLGIFPPAKWALADGYDIYQQLDDGPCHQTSTGNGYGYAKQHNCSPGCGPSPICDHRSMGPCCDNNGWHRNDGAAGYYLRPNDCFRALQWPDGWRWRCDSNTVYRCNDGWFRCCADWYPDVCRKNV
jgi:hypothetical protein